MRNLLEILVLAVFAASCSQFDERPSSALVLEAWIDTDGYPTAILTQSFDPSKGSNLSDIVVRWGKVTISDGDDSVVMTGSYTKSFLPPFRYYTFAMTGRPGKEYTVTAEYDGMTIQAKSRMLEPTPIDSIAFENVEGEDSLRAAKLYFTTPDDCPAYYYITVRKLLDHVVTQPGLGMFSTTEALEPGKTVSLPVYNPKNNVDSLVYVANLIVGDALEVNLCRVEKRVYDFWHDYDNYTMFGNSQFISSPGALTGNVVGGYGIFSAQATSTRRFIVE